MTTLIVVSWIASLCVVFVVGLRVGRWDAEPESPPRQKIDPLTESEQAHWQRHCSTFGGWKETVANPARKADR